MAIPKIDLNHAEGHIQDAFTHLLSQFNLQKWWEVVEEEEEKRQQNTEPIQTYTKSQARETGCTKWIEFTK